MQQLLMAVRGSSPACGRPSEKMSSGTCCAWGPEFGAVRQLRVTQTAAWTNSTRLCTPNWR